MVYIIRKEDRKKREDIELIKNLFLIAYKRKESQRMTPCQILDRVAREFFQQRFEIMNGRDYRKAIDNIDKRTLPYKTQVAYKAALFIDYMKRESLNLQA